MKLTLIACTDNPEILWNVFRLGNLALEKMDDVTIFLNGPSVNYSALDSERFPLRELAKLFTLSEGALLA
ncbi:MAG: sulfur reduction protein DsrE [Desulfobacteraceae bacterium]|nr:sulfur reduction protein DsrE [Desulfobacteraceae bacterium]